MIKSLRLLTVLAAVVAAASATFAQEPSGLKRITIASAVRIRSGPGATSAVLDTVSIGTLMRELGRSDRTETIGDRQDYWYRVGLPGGKEGWVFGGLTQPVDAAQLDEAHLRIARERVARDDLSFPDILDAIAFLGRASAGAGSRDAKGELEMAVLQMTSRAGDSIPFDKKGEAPYKAWLDRNVGTTVFHDEISGGYVVKQELYWQLYERYADTGAADEMAWAAARARLGGECEGDVGCNLVAFNRTHGRYLAVRPGGRHAAEVVKDFIEYLESVRHDLSTESSVYVAVPNDAGWAKDFRDAAAEARRTLARSGVSGSDRAMALLDEIEKAVFATG